MRLARVRVDGREEFAFGVEGRPGWLTAERLGLTVNALDDLLDQIDDVRARASRLEPNCADDAPLLAPVGRPGKILAVGLNYRRHIEEVRKPKPRAPMIFAKYPSALTGPNDVIELNPEVTAQVDYEGELAVVIGSPARRVSADTAMNHVLGYCVANDVSARDIQRNESQISRSKSLDTFCPIGPWITTSDVVPEPHRLGIRTTVNGETRQDSTTGDLLFDVPFLISYLSRTMTLLAGDVILTGTPSGVGSGMSPPSYLQEGDVVRCQIELLGHIENRVVSPVGS